MIKNRFKASSRAALIHLFISLIIGLFIYLATRFIIYPYPFNETGSADNIFRILIISDIICGPLLTLVLFSPGKSKNKWRIDIALIIFIQIIAATYGISKILTNRPVYLGFEEDRFRVVRAGDVILKNISEAPKNLQELPFFGPKIIGVHLLTSKDMDYLESIIASGAGLHPAFRPERWIEYDSQLSILRKNVKSLEHLIEMHPEARDLIEKNKKLISFSMKDMGYLPLVQDLNTDWVVVIKLSDGSILDYLHIDGWD